MTQTIRLKRIHDPVDSADGLRVLVDRLWPRGIRKADARLDHWLRDVAPSAQLRRWFGHDPNRWAAFQRRYREELAQSPEALESLLCLCREHEPVTLLFAARDREHNQAVVLRQVLLEQLPVDRLLKPQ